MHIDCPELDEQARVPDHAWLRSENDRIARHLLAAETVVRAREVSHLSRAVQRVRAFLLDALRRYRLARRYPRNRDFGAPTPYFIDAEGTRCAMAHLLEIAGADALVARVSRSANNARVEDLARDSEFLRWLSATGFTLEDAARIQPSYCSKRASCYCDEGPRHLAIADASFVATDSGPLTVRVDTIRAGDGFGVGDLVVLNNYTGPTTPATKLLVALYRPTTTAYAYGLPRSYTWGGRSCADTVSIVPLTEAEMIAAVRATDCVGTLVARDARFGELVCVGSDIGIPEAGPTDSAADVVVDASIHDVAIDSSVADTAPPTASESGVQDAPTAEVGSMDTSIAASSDAAPLLADEATGGGCSVGAASVAEIPGVLLAFAGTVAVWVRRRGRRRRA